MHITGQVALSPVTGRHHKPKPIPVSERLCLHCNEVEDEIHHVLFCNRFIDIRHILTEACCETYSAFNEIRIH